MSVNVYAEKNYKNYDNIVALLKETTGKIPIEIIIDEDFAVEYKPSLAIFTYGSDNISAKEQGISALLFTFEKYVPDIENRFEIKITYL